MKKERRKLTKGAIGAIISIAVAATLICTIFIINMYFPLKYTLAYFTRRSRSPSDGMYIHVLDMGQADCTIVEFPDGKTMLIDGGDGSYKNTNAIIKTLNSLDIDEIDYLVCTSVNGEHCGGLADIISLKKVDIIYCPYIVNKYITDSYYSFYEAALGSGAEIVISEYGKGAQGGKGDTQYFFTFLAPSVYTNVLGEYYAVNSSPTDENIGNASAILWLECGGSGVFYAGDSYSSVLSSLIESYLFYEESGLGYYFSYGEYGVDFSRCVLYKAANHGSYDSICSELYSLLAPDISVISVGEDNADGCPSVYVMSDLYNYGELYMTMHDGNITVKIDSNGASVTTKKS